MIKKTSMFIWSILLLFSIIVFDVNALDDEEIYYENSNGVKFTKTEYDFVGEFYYEGYQENMTLEHLQRLKDDDVMTKQINTIVYDDGGIQPLYDEVSYQSASKKLVMSYACGSTCSVTLRTTWLTVANTRSYDLIGVYSPNSNALEYQSAIMRYSGKDYSPNEKNNSSNGISATFKLPSTDDKYVFILEFRAPSGTKVYGSYQHAKKSISLANSRKYSYASSGYGGVFKFDSSVSGYYDGMGGVVATLK
ncbi:MAG: hypothetical protein K2G03_03200 [Bacilli bacterium]|nr:hypothetical protein [Bacilli bacterium]